MYNTITAAIFCGLSLSHNHLKTLKNVTRCRDSRSAKSRETR